MNQTSTARHDPWQSILTPAGWRSGVLANIDPTTGPITASAAASIAIADKPPDGRNAPESSALVVESSRPRLPGLNGSPLPNRSTVTDRVTTGDFEVDPNVLVLSVDLLGNVNVQRIEHETIY